MRLIIIPRVSGEWAVNTAAIYCPALLMKAAPLPSPGNTSVKHAAHTQSHNTKQQRELLKWQTNWLLDSEALCMGGSPLAITFLQSGGTAGHADFTRASLSFYLAVNPYCCWRTPGSEVQIVQNKHAHAHARLWENNDTSAKGCLATGCMRGSGAQETRNVNTHTLTY